MDALRTKPIDFPFKQCKNGEDHPQKPFIRSFGLMEGEPDPTSPTNSAAYSDMLHPHMYGCAINPFVPEDDDQIAVAVGLRNVYLYQLPVEKPEVEKLGQVTINVPEDKETLYTVTWCFDSLDKRREHKIICGGACGVLYVVDGSSLKVDRELIGHTREINDVRTCPTNSSLVVSSSKDRTVRVFHIREETCLLLFGGRVGHKDSVVSADWAFDAKTIMSAGFDQKIVIWDLEYPRVKEHLKKCLEKIQEGKPVASFVNDLESLERLHSGEAIYDLEGHTLTINRPTSVIKDLHFDTIDCIRSIKFNDTNYVLSKAVGQERNITLWRTGLLDPNGDHHPDQGISTSFVQIWQKKIKNWQYYFSKIAVDPLKKWVAVTTSDGTLNFYELLEREDSDRPFLSYNLKTSQAHDVSFSANGQILLCVCSKGLVVRLDRVPETYKKEEPEDLWI